MVRAWSAMARVMACRIHQVAYVLNLKPFVVVELFHGLDQPQVPFLDQIQEQHAPAHIPFGNADHQTQVGFGQTFLGIVPAEFHAVEQAVELFPGFLDLFLEVFIHLLVGSLVLDHCEQFLQGPQIAFISFFSLGRSTVFTSCITLYLFSVSNRFNRFFRPW